jgi:protein TonB
MGRVFNVAIVEAEPQKSHEIKRSKPILEKRPSARRRRRPLVKEPPDTIRDVSPASPSGKGGDTAVAALPKNGNGFLPDKGLEAIKPWKETGPSFLFDREVIEKYASKVPQPEKDLTFNTSELKHRGYMRILKEKIESIWKYPKDAVRQNRSGDLYIMFTIKRNGELGDVEILRTSGHRSLDMAAMKALKDAEPFWPLPDDWQKDSLEIKGHFIYIYGRTHIM